jgi:hypothetical protein
VFDITIRGFKISLFLNQVVGIAAAISGGAYIQWYRTLQTPPVQSFFFFERISDRKKKKIEKRLLQNHTEQRKKIRKSPKRINHITSSEIPLVESV